MLNLLIQILIEYLLCNHVVSLLFNIAAANMWWCVVFVLVSLLFIVVEKIKLLYIFGFCGCVGNYLYAIEYVFFFFFFLYFLFFYNLLLNSLLKINFIATANDRSNTLQWSRTVFLY